MRKFLVVAACLLVLVGCDRGREAFMDACKRQVEQRLRSPGSASYGALKDTFTNPALGSGDEDGYSNIDGHRAWMGYVDSSNAFGASRRAVFACQQSPGEPLRLVLSDEVPPAELEGQLDELFGG